MPRQTSVQLTEATQRQADELKQAGFGTFTDIVRIAVDRLHRAEVGSTEMDDETFRDIYAEGWRDGVDGALRDNPYVDPEERTVYAKGRQDGEQYYREHADD